MASPLQLNNIQLLPFNQIDPTNSALVLTPSSQVSPDGLVGNITDYRPNYVWITSGCALESVIIDMGSVQSVSTLIWWNVNWSNNSQIQADIYNDPSDITPVSPIASGTVGGAQPIANGTYALFVRSASGTTWNTVVVSGGSLTVNPNGSDPVVTEWAAFTDGVLTAPQMIAYAETGSTGGVLYSTGFVPGRQATGGLGTMPLGGDPLTGLGGYPTDLVFQSSDPYRIQVLPTTYQARYIRLQIKDPTNPNGFLSLGRGFAGIPYIPPLNFTVGWPHAWVDMSSLVTNSTGSVRIVKKNKFRTDDFSWDFIDQNYAFSFFDGFMQTIGTSHDMFVLPFPNQDNFMQPKTAIYGVPTVNGPLVASQNPMYYSVKLSMRLLT